MKVTFEWNTDMEKAKKMACILAIFENSDGSKGIGYTMWDSHDKCWLSHDATPLTLTKPIAWILDEAIFPKELE